jgi:large subunit ribosomal protein L22
MKTNGSNSEEIRTLAKYILMFAHKTWRVINQIYGCLYEQALMLLEFMPYRTWHPILQLLSSITTNANCNSNLNKTNLIISEVRVDGCITLKIFQPKA